MWSDLKRFCGGTAWPRPVSGSAALAGTPNQGLFYMLLALGAGRAGLDGQASRLFRLHCLIHPGDLQGYYNFGNFRLRLEQRDEAAGLCAPR